MNVLALDEVGLALERNHEDGGALDALLLRQVDVHLLPLEVRDLMKSFSVKRLSLGSVLGREDLEVGGDDGLADGVDGLAAVGAVVVGPSVLQVEGDETEIVQG